MAAAERSSVLDEKCGTDKELRREIESLIAAHSKAAERFESPAVEKMAAVVSNERADGLVGRSLGQYEVIDKLGAGGMGEACRISSQSSCYERNSGRPKVGTARS